MVRSCRLVWLWCLLSATVGAQCATIGAFSPRGNVPTNLQPAGAGTQISGIAASRHNPGVLWVHDDASTTAQLIALRSDASLARQYLLPVATNRDWEDIALGPGPIAGRDYLYVADIGNNALAYTTFSIWRVPEPDVPPGSGPPVTLPAPESFSFRYPAGTWNAETLWIDPVDGAPWLLTKVNATTCSLFRYPMPLDATTVRTLVLAATLTGMPTSFTGGGMSHDGRHVLARTQSAIHVWPRPSGTTIATALSVPACSFAAAQGQAEAIAVAADGTSLWAVSEGPGATLRQAPLQWPAGAPLWHAFGSGLAGGVGVPGLGATAVLRLGGPATSLAAWQLPPGAPTLLLVSLTALPAGTWPWQGGWLHAAPDTVVPLVVDARGETVWPVPPLPDLPAAWGLPVHAQVLAADPSGPVGHVLSAGLRVVLDR